MVRVGAGERARPLFSLTARAVALSCRRYAIEWKIGRLGGYRSRSGLDPPPIK